MNGWPHSVPERPKRRVIFMDENTPAVVECQRRWNRTYAAKMKAKEKAEGKKKAAGKKDGICVPPGRVSAKVYDPATLGRRVQAAEKELVSLAWSEAPIRGDCLVGSTPRVELDELSYQAMLARSLKVHNKVLRDAVNDKGCHGFRREEVVQGWLTEQGLEAASEPFLEEEGTVAPLLKKMAEVMQADYKQGEGDVVCMWYEQGEFSKLGMDFAVLLLRLWLRFAKEGRINHRRAPRKRTVSAVFAMMAAVFGVEMDPFGEHWFKFTKDRMRKSFFFLLVETGPGFDGLDLSEFIDALLAYVQCAPSGRVDRVQEILPFIVPFLAFATLDQSTTLPHLRGIWGNLHLVSVKELAKVVRSPVSVDMVSACTAPLYKGLVKHSHTDRLLVAALSAMAKTEEILKRLVKKANEKPLLRLLDALCRHVKTAGSDVVKYMTIPDRFSGGLGTEVIQALAVSPTILAYFAGCEKGRKRRFTKSVWELVCRIAVAVFKKGQKPLRDRATALLSNVVERMPPSFKKQLKASFCAAREKANGSALLRKRLDVPAKEGLPKTWRPRVSRSSAI